ncbi:hypothetical protein HG530_006891 [Fusarium avenaceum]|nr:hypothetical protein HG530_006891 [Fusarium avenaceum]
MSTGTTFDLATGSSASSSISTSSSTQASTSSEMSTTRDLTRRLTRATATKECGSCFAQRSKGSQSREDSS